MLALHAGGRNKVLTAAGRRRILHNSRRQRRARILAAGKLAAFGGQPNDTDRLVPEVIGFKAIRFHPSDTGRIVSCHGLSCPPLRQQIYERVVVFDLPARIPSDRIDDRDDITDLDVQTGFLPHFAASGLRDRLAGLLNSARYAPPALSRRLAAPDKQHFFTSKDEGADSNEGSLGIGPGHRPRMARNGSQIIPAS